MADQQQQGGKKILGMRRGTGLVVIGLAAVVVGYFVIGRLSGGGSATTAGAGTATTGQVYQPGGGTTFIQIVRRWQDHDPRRKHHVPDKKRSWWT